MKANELMIGDWVHYAETSNDRKVGIGDFTAPEELEPIPLTAEILEKNGWKRNGDYPEYNLPINGVVGWSMDTHMIRIRNNTDFETNDIFVRCGFVHELQHALRLCGLNELADNFKV